MLIDCENLGRSDFDETELRRRELIFLCVNKILEYYGLMCITRSFSFLYKKKQNCNNLKGLFELRITRLKRVDKCNMFYNGNRLVNYDGWLHILNNSHPRD